MKKICINGIGIIIKLYISLVQNFEISKPYAIFLIIFSYFQEISSLLSNSVPWLCVENPIWYSLLKIFKFFNINVLLMNIRSGQYTYIFVCLTNMILITHLLLIVYLAIKISFKDPKNIEILAYTNFKSFKVLKFFSEIFLWVILLPSLQILLNYIQENKHEYSNPQDLFFILAIIGLILVAILIIIDYTFNIDDSYESSNFLVSSSTSSLPILTYIFKIILVLMEIFATSSIEKFIFCLILLLLLSLKIYSALSNYTYYHLKIERLNYMMLIIIWNIIFLLIITEYFEYIHQITLNSLTQIVLIILITKCLFMANRQYSKLICSNSNLSANRLDKKLKLLIYMLRTTEESEEKTEFLPRQLNPEDYLLISGYIRNHIETCKNMKCTCKGIKHEYSLYDCLSKKTHIVQKFDEETQYMYPVNLHPIYIKHLLKNEYIQGIINYPKDARLHLSFASFLFYKINHTHLVILECFLLRKMHEENKASLRIEISRRRLIENVQKHLDGLDKNITKDPKISNLDINGIRKLEKNYDNMDSLIDDYTLKYFTFIREIDQEFTRLDKLSAICSDLIQKRLIIKTIYKKYLKNNPRSICLYANFLQYNLFRDDKAIKEMKKYDKLIEKIEIYRRQEHEFFEIDLMFSEISSIVQIGAAKNNLGKIIRTNAALEGLFGFNADELKLMNVSILTPKLIRSRHDSFLTNYFDTGREIILYREQKTFARNKSGEIFPISLLVKPMVNLETGEFQFISYLKHIKTLDDFILTNKFGVIDGVTENIRRMFNLTYNILEQEKIYIQMLCQEMKFFFLEDDIPILDEQGKNKEYTFRFFVAKNFETYTLNYRKFVTRSYFDMFKNEEKTNYNSINDEYLSDINKLFQHIEPNSMELVVTLTMEIFKSQEGNTQIMIFRIKNIMPLETKREASFQNLGQSQYAKSNMKNDITEEILTDKRSESLSQPGSDIPTNIQKFIQDQKLSHLKSLPGRFNIRADNTSEKNAEISGIPFKVLPSTSSRFRLNSVSQLPQVFSKLGQNNSNNILDESNTILSRNNKLKKSELNKPKTFIGAGIPQLNTVRACVDKNEEKGLNSSKNELRIQQDRDSNAKYSQAAETRKWVKIIKKEHSPASYNIMKWILTLNFLIFLGSFLGIQATKSINYTKYNQLKSLLPLPHQLNLNIFDLLNNYWDTIIYYELLNEPISLIQNTTQIFTNNLNESWPKRINSLNEMLYIMQTKIIDINQIYPNFDVLIFQTPSNKEIKNIFVLRNIVVNMSMIYYDYLNILNGQNATHQYVTNQTIYKHQKFLSIINSINQYILTSYLINEPNILPSFLLPTIFVLLELILAGFFLYQLNVFSMFLGKKLMLLVSLDQKEILQLKAFLSETCVRFSNKDLKQEIKLLLESREAKTKKTSWNHKHNPRFFLKQFLKEKILYLISVILLLSTYYLCNVDIIFYQQAEDILTCWNKFKNLHQDELEIVINYKAYVYNKLTNDSLSNEALYHQIFAEELNDVKDLIESSYISKKRLNNDDTLTFETILTKDQCIYSKYYDKCQIVFNGNFKQGLYSNINFFNDYLTNKPFQTKLSSDQLLANLNDINLALEIIYDGLEYTEQLLQSAIDNIMCISFTITIFLTIIFVCGGILQYYYFSQTSMIDFRKTASKYRIYLTLIPPALCLNNPQIKSFLLQKLSRKSFM